MHELPKDLANSVRSWRASIYGTHSLRHEPTHLEKGQDDFGDKDFELALNPTESSVVLVQHVFALGPYCSTLTTAEQHPTKSRQALNQTQQQQLQQQQQQHGQRRLQHRASQAQLREHPRSNALDNGTETVVVRRQGNLPPRTPASAKKDVFGAAPKVSDPDPAADRLDDDTTPLMPADFYELMGMRAPASKQQNPRELAIRHGLYGKIQGRLSYIQTKYRIFDVLTYVFLILQLLLSAVFIVLGSLTKVDSHVAIAALGAVSTVIAGALALMKGQGLPNRLRQTRDGLRNVIFEAEELYWDVGAERSVYYMDIKKIREDYLRVTEDARRNHPDTWTAVATGVAQGIKTSSAAQKPTLAQAATPKP